MNTSKFICVFGTVIVLSFFGCKTEKPREVVCGELSCVISKDTLSIRENNIDVPFVSIPLKKSMIGQIDTVSCETHRGHKDTLVITVFTGGASCCYDSFYFYPDTQKVYLEWETPSENGRTGKEFKKTILWNEVLYPLSYSLGVL